MHAQAKHPNHSKKLNALHYQSPFQILNRAGLHSGKELQKADLLLARKVLLAELDLHNQSTIQWDGREMGRDDILKMFDLFEAEFTIEYHNAIIFALASIVLSAHGWHLRHSLVVATDHQLKKLWFYE